MLEFLIDIRSFAIDGLYNMSESFGKKIEDVEPEKLALSTTFIGDMFEFIFTKGVLVALLFSTTAVASAVRVTREAQSNNGQNTFLPNPVRVVGADYTLAQTAVMLTL